MRGLNKKKGIKIICEICSNVIFVKLSWKGRRFCSMACVGKHQETSLLGKKNPSWSGNRVGYNGIHIWIKKYFGKALYCENKNCPKKSKVFEWALIRGKEYERKRRNFIQLCKSCHSTYDKVVENFQNQKVDYKRLKRKNIVLCEFTNPAKKQQVKQKGN